MRLIVTGSRDWGIIQTPTGPEPVPSEVKLLCDVLGYYVLETWHRAEPLIVVHGDCPDGADKLTRIYVELSRAENPGCHVYQDPHPADWNRYGRRAGFVRNKHMVDIGANICVAFIKNNSKGATMCANLAESAGIPTFRYTPEFRI